MKSLPRWGEKIVGDDLPDSKLLLNLDGEYISKVELFKRHVVIDGKRFKLLGIGGVWTSSKNRRRGCASALLILARAFAVKWGYSGTILFSLEDMVPFYVSHGYTRHVGPATMQQPGTVCGVSDHVAVLTLGIGEWFDPEAALAVEGLPW